MGSFHCPFGSPFYEGNGCILCGLCLAETREAMNRASEKVKAYIRLQKDRKEHFKKIIVCGKGGVGKSTLVALIAKVLQDQDYGVLVVDMDESNPGLYHKLGLMREPAALTNLLSRGAGSDPDPKKSWIDQEEISPAEIPAEYISESEGLKLMEAGKIEDPFQGCACSMADLTRSFIEKLCLADNEIALIDAEAGVESFGRGVERCTDTVLIVVEPSYESLAIAEKISAMAEEIGIPYVRAILNKVPSEDIRKKMVQSLVMKNISPVGAIPHDLEIALSGFEGRAPGAAKAGKEIKSIVRRLLSDAP